MRLSCLKKEVILKKNGSFVNKRRNKLEKMIPEMIKTQAELNKIIYINTPPTSKADWGLCMSVEASEAVDHLGYKHWKKQVVDMDQFRLEVVDILHFYISLAIESDKRTSMIKSFIEAFDKGSSFLDLKEDKTASRLDLIAGLVNVSSSLQVDLDMEKGVISSSTDYLKISQAVGFLVSISLDLDALNSLYIGKNTLNFFRQNNGYHLGTYKKIFSDGREDNEHLTDIISDLNKKNSPITKSEVLLELSLRY